MRIPVQKIIVLIGVFGIAALLSFAVRYVLGTHRGLFPGDQLPDVPLESFDGDRLDSGSWRGSPILLVLIAPDCPSCRAEIWDLELIASEMPDLNVVLVSANGSPLTMNTSFPVYRDPSGKFLERTRKVSLPAVYWLDETGQVKYARAGRRPFSSDLLLFKTLMGSRQ